MRGYFIKDASMCMLLKEGDVITKGFNKIWRLAGTTHKIPESETDPLTYSHVIGVTLLDPVYRFSEKGKLTEATCFYGDGISGIIKRVGANVNYYHSIVKHTAKRSAVEVALDKAALRCKTYLLKEGFYETKDKAKSNVNTIKSCTLLKVWDDIAKDKLSWPLIGSPKINGIRGVIYNTPCLISRGGNVLDAPHLLSQIKSAGEASKEVYLDGEVAIPGASLERIQSVLMKQDHPDKRELHYFIFDVPLKIPFNKRLCMLEQWKEVFKACTTSYKMES